MIRGSAGREKRRESTGRSMRVSLFYDEFLFFFFFFFRGRPKKRFYGKDCCSLAVAIGAGMDLRSILPHSTRRDYPKLGLLSLKKYNLSLVMDFLDPQAILPSSQRQFFPNICLLLLLQHLATLGCAPHHFWAVRLTFFIGPPFWLLPFRK